MTLAPAEAARSTKSVADNIQSKVTRYCCRHSSFMAAVLLSAVSYHGGFQGILIIPGLLLFFHFIYAESKKLLYALIYSIIVQGYSLVWLTDVTISGWLALSVYNAVFLVLFFIYADLKSPVRSAFLIGVIFLIRSRLGTGSPFGQFSEALSDIPLLIQSASLGGVIFVDFLIVLFVLELLWGMRNRNVVRAVIIVVIVLFFGCFRIYILSLKKTSGKDELKLSVIQPSFSPSLKWNHVKEQEKLEIVESLSIKAVDNETDLLIWPETVFTYDYRNNKRAKEIFERIRSEYSINFLFGAEDSLSAKGEYYNAAFFLGENLKEERIYHKTILVPFGEYIPFRKILPWVSLLTPVKQEFSPGTKKINMLLDGFTFTPLICFEDTLSDFVLERSFDSDFVITLTNDGWFEGLRGMGAHNRLSRFRTLETGLQMIKCANTGVTVHFDALGRTVSSLAENESGALKTTIKKEKLFSLFRYVKYYWLLLFIFFIRKKNNKL